MDVNSLSSSDFYREFSDFVDLISKISTDDYFAEDDSSNGYRAWLIVAYCAMLVIGVIGNVWVASVIGCVLRASNRHFGVLGAQAAEAPKAIQIYILTLCCSDLVVLAFLLFLIADLIHGRWIWPSSTSLCRLYLCTESLNKFCGPFLLVALSGYCYVSVCKRHWKTSPRFVTSSTVTCVIVIGICFALVLLLITPVYIYGDVQFLIIHNGSTIYSVTPKCALQPPESVLAAFTIYSFLCGYVTPAFLFTFFYASILMCAYKQVTSRVQRKSRKQEAARCLDSARAGSARCGRRSYLTRVVKTSLGLVLFYLICWTPYWMMCLWTVYLSPHHGVQESMVGVVFGYLIHMLPYINCTGYPIMYTVLNKTIKDAYRRRANDKRNSTLCTLSVKPKRNLVRNGLDTTITKPHSCLIEVSLAASTSFASNSQTHAAGRASKELLSHTRT